MRPPAKAARQTALRFGQRPARSFASSGAVYHTLQTIDAYGGLNTVSAQTWEGVIRIVRKFVKAGGPAISEHSLATRMGAASSLGVQTTRDPKRFRKASEGKSRFANVLIGRYVLAEINESSDLWDIAVAVATVFTGAVRTRACVIEMFSSAHLVTGEFIRASACFGKKMSGRFDDVAFVPAEASGVSNEAVYERCSFGQLRYLFRLVAGTESFDLALVQSYTPVGGDGHRRLGRRYLSEADQTSCVVPLSAVIAHAHLVPDPADNGKFYAMCPSSTRLYSPQRRTVTPGTGWNLQN